MELHLSDDEVIARVLGGDIDAYSQLFERYKAYIAKVLSRYLPPQDLEDVLLDVFTTAFHKLDSFEARGSFRHWVAAIATRRAYDYLRKKKRRKETPISALGDAHEDWIDKVSHGKSVAAFEREQEIKLASDVLQWALEQLSPKDRMVITLTFFEEKTSREAAEVLGWSEVNVRVTSMRARKTLRKILESASGEKSI